MPYFFQKSMIRGDCRTAPVTLGPLIKTMPVPVNIRTVQFKRYAQKEHTHNNVHNTFTVLMLHCRLCTLLRVTSCLDLVSSCRGHRDPPVICTLDRFRDTVSTLYTVWTLCPPDRLPGHSISLDTIQTHFGAEMDDTVWMVSDNGNL